jgi:Tol biopolymer transport system component
LLTVNVANRRVTGLVTTRRGWLDSAAFSPDGRRLAFLSESSGITARIEICDFRLGSTRLLRLPIEASRFPLSWSRDGETLLFLGGDSLGYGADQKPYLVHIDNGALNELGGSAPWYWDGAALSPDSKKLAFLLQLKYPGGEEPERLVVFDPVAATFEKIVGSNQVAQIDSLSWSPDGRKIVFCAYRGDAQGDLYIADVRTKHVTPLLATGAGERRPAWSPDARWVAFERSPKGHPRKTSIWMVEVETGRVQRVTRSQTDVAPAWSPDGTEIAFVRR